MAIKFATSNLSDAQYNLYNIEKFNGVDYTTTPTLVDESRAIEISNYLPKGNSLVKRNGVKMVSKLLSSSSEYYIHNIWEDPNTYTTEKKGFFLYVSLKSKTEKDKFYNPAIVRVYDLLNTDDFEIVYKFPDYNYASPKYLTKDEMYSYGVHYEGKLFILCNNHYLINIYDEERDNYFSDVEDYAYIPTVILGLGDYRGTSKNTFNQEFNLLSNKCKVEIIKYSYEDGNQESIVKYYDLEQFFKGFNSFTITKINGVEVDKDALESSEGIYLDGIGTISLKERTGAENRKLLKILTQLKSTDTTKYDDMYIYLEIEYSNEFNANKLVQNMRFGVPYGSYGNKDRLFLSGNPNYPNLDIHSCEASDSLDLWADYTYFGDNSYAMIGNSETAIKGYGYLNNGSMTIFKESKYNSPNLYFRTVEMNQDSEGNYKEVYPITISGLSIDVPVDNKIINYRNDLLVNNPKGIFKIMAGESTATQTYKSNEMSYFIREDLGNRIDNSASIVFDDKLYISREDKNGKKRIYVADCDSYGYHDGVQVYEWFVLDDIDVDKFFVINDELYFVNEKGIYKFNTDTFEDSWFLETKNANINEVEFSEEVFVAVNEVTDKIVLSPTNEIMQKTIAKNSWEDFKRKTRIKFSNWFCIERDYTNVIVTQDSINKTLTFAFNENEIDFMSMEILNQLVFNCDKNEASPENYPKIIYNITLYTIRKLEFLEYGYRVTYDSMQTLDNNPQNKFAICLNSKLQDFDFEISELYCNDTYEFSKCELDDGAWYIPNEDGINLDYVGEQSSVYFNYFTLKLLGYDIDFTSLAKFNSKETNSLKGVVLTFKTPVTSYWRSKFNAFGRLDYLKTIDRATFVADAVRGGKTSVGYKTTFKKANSQSGFLYKNELGFVNRTMNAQSMLVVKEKEKQTELLGESSLDFNDIDFSYFTFSKEAFAQTYTTKKKIKNFAFVQLSFESNEAEDSTIVSLSLRYKFTRNNKGVK